MDHLEVVNLLQPAGGKVWEDGKVRMGREMDAKGKTVWCRGSGQAISLAGGRGGGQWGRSSNGKVLLR